MFTRIITACMVIVIVVFILMMLLRPEHRLAKAIGLPVVDDVSDSSMHFSKRVLVFSKMDVDYDLYEFICAKTVAMYGEEDFKAGVELSEIPKFDLIDVRYSQSQTRAFRIDSRDQYASIWVIDYKDYVGVFLLQGR